MKTLALLLFWLCCAAPLVLAETRIFDLQHRRAEDLAETVQTALGSEAKVVPVEHSLMVSAPAAEVAMAAELIVRLDRPARMLRVYVTQNQQEKSTASAGSGSIRVHSGDATIMVGGRSGGDPRGAGGATIMVGGDHGAIIGSGRAGSRVETHRAEQFLATIEGSPARISVGRRLPFSERWLVLARRHAHILETTRYESVDTGFEVLPELLPGGQVELTIRPFMAFVDPHRDREIRFRELSTRVRIPLDAWFDLAGTMSSRDEISREILGAAQTRQGESGEIRIRVELQAE